MDKLDTLVPENIENNFFGDDLFEKPIIPN